MNKSKYRISKRAIEDLNGIWSYTYQQWPKEQADRYYALIIGEIEFITDNYMAGKSADHIRKGYRVTQVKSHLIFYRELGNDIVEVVRILHQRMGIKETNVRLHMMT